MNISYYRFKRNYYNERNKAVLKKLGIYIDYEDIEYVYAIGGEIDESVFKCLEREIEFEEISYNTYEINRRYKEIE